MIRRVRHKFDDSAGPACGSAGAAGEQCSPALISCWRNIHYTTFGTVLTRIRIRKDARILGPAEDNTLKIEERMKSAVQLLSAGATYIGSVRLSPQYAAVIRRI